MNRNLLLAAALLAGTRLLAAGAPLYHQDFQSLEPGPLPADLLVLDGAFSIRAEGPARFVELPGAPLETFGVLFGPNLTNQVAARVRCFGTSVGRRYPTFAVGLGGVNGYKLRISPGKKQVELLRGDTVLRGEPFAWKSGQWTHLHLQLRTEGPAWKVEGRAWNEGEPEPEGWTISLEIADAPRPGRASFWGAPFASTPIRFDDLLVSPVPAGP